mgnify:FL=1
MSYQDQLNAINQYGSYLNYGNYGQGTYGVNPYSSAAYGPSFENLMSQFPAPTHPLDPYKNMTREDRLMGKIGMASLALNAGAPVGGFLGKGIAGGFDMFGKTGVGWGTGKAADLTLGKRFEGFSLAAPMALYGLTRDQNPYTYTPTEAFGTISTGALTGGMIGSKIAPGIGTVAGAAIGLLGGFLMSGAQRRAAERKKKEAIEQYAEDMDDRKMEIEEALVKQREDRENYKEAALWHSEQSKYKNQYGAYVNPGVSYMYDGGKIPKYNGGGEYGQQDTIWGCTDSEALNYNPNATIDDGTCESGAAYMTGRDEEGNPYMTGEDMHRMPGLNPDQLSEEQWERYQAYENRPIITTPPRTFLDPIERNIAEKPILDISRPKKEKINKKDLNININPRSETESREDYRWDLKNPLIRENVDIFDEGGISGETSALVSSTTLPMDSLLNRQLFTESSFIADAESSAGAIGLGQFTEDTFDYAVSKGWVPEGKTYEDLKTDTDLAVSLQEQYMGSLMNRKWNTGNEQVRRAKALAAYNMGPTKLVRKLNKLRKEGKDIYESLDWVDSLNDETKNYVRKILEGGTAEFERQYSQAYQAGGSEYLQGGKWSVNGKDYERTNKKDNGEIIKLMNKHGLKEDHSESDEKRRSFWKEAVKKGYYTRKTSFAQGGRANIVAEFTGNELIVNNQDLVEKGLASGNDAMAAAPIREAMNAGYITPGEETHKNNPMPVDASGNIYVGGGTLNFRVNKGAGIYDHATDQFKPDMSDKEIARVAKKNINKWKSNNMYS